MDSNTLNITDVSDKNDGALPEDVNFGNRLATADAKYTAEDNLSCPVEIDEEIGYTPLKRTELQSARSSLTAKKLLAIGAMTAGLSVQNDLLVPRNLGYKMPKSYSPGPSTRGNKNVNFTKKKKASKIAAKSKRANRN